jgi:hypothetical protein
MGHINGVIKLVETQSQIMNRIVESLAEHLNRAFNTAVPQIQTRVRNVVREAILNSPEYTALTTGLLQGQLGVEHPESDFEGILDIWINSIVARSLGVSHNGRNLTGGIQIVGIQGDYTDVLSSPFASYVSLPSTSTIEWLKWLLISGNSIIVRKYYFKSANSLETRLSRTGLGLMRASKTGTFRVPAEYAGTVNDNFVTRSLSSVVDQIEEIIIREVENSI